MLSREGFGLSPYVDWFGEAHEEETLTPREPESVGSCCTWQNIGRYLHRNVLHLKDIHCFVIHFFPGSIIFETFEQDGPAPTIILPALGCLCSIEEGDSYWTDCRPNYVWLGHALNVPMESFMVPHDGPRIARPLEIRSRTTCCIGTLTGTGHIHWKKQWWMMLVIKVRGRVWSSQRCV